MKTTKYTDSVQAALDVAAYDAAKAESVASGGETLSSEEMKTLLGAATPLAFWRGKRGLTQAQLARAADISQSYVAGLESGARRGEPALFKRLAAALRVRMEDIVGD